MRCPACNADNPAGKKFCGDCGAALAAPCAHCGADNPPGKRFCGECGSKIGSEGSGVASAAKAASSAKIESPNIESPKIESPKIAEGGERRHLTVLFSDLVGSTEIASRLDGETWHEIAAAYQTESAAAVSRLGGHVTKFLGDGLVVTFGYPRAMEDSAERAVRAGLAILEAMAKLNKKFASLGETLQVRVGIHSGAVVVAQGGGKDADMFGDVPNIAARVQTAALADSVFITEATHRLVTGLFVLEDEGAQPLKGVPRPVRLYRVTGANVSRRKPVGELTPFVGREDEVALLTRRFERARDGEGQLVLVMGEPGIGKSRLLEEFRARIKDDPHLWVSCACEELHGNTPFHAVTQMIEMGLAWRDDEAPAEKLAQLERALEATGVKLDEALPLIGELLALPVPADSPALKFSPEQKRKRLFAALAGWVLGTARNQPLVLVTEDLHWADPSTMAWLQMLADQGASGPLLMLCTSRPEFRAPWPMRAHHAQLALNRLNDKQTREMVSGFLARSGFLKDVVEGVIKRTDGVPLFVEEVARLMLEGDRRPGAQEIPATLQDSLAARLDRLGAAKDVAQIGAVIGREFSYALLQAVSNMEETALQSSLTRLSDDDLIQARGFPPDATYQFKHALMQDAAYDGLLKARRQDLHARVARAIEERFPQLAESQPQLLASHWTEAGRTEPAIAAWIKAAGRADARSAFEEAENAYRQALTLVRALPETPERDARELDILTPLIVVAASASSWDSHAVTELSSRAGVLAEKSGNLAQLVMQRFATVVSHYSAGDRVRALALADQLFDLAGREGGDFSLRCAHEAQIMCRLGAGDFAAVESHFDAWKRLCERAGYGPFPGETTGIWSAASTCAWHLGRADTARERAERGIAIGRQSNNPVDLISALTAKVTLGLMTRDPALTEATAREGLALAEKSGLARSVSGFSFPLAWAQAQLGEPEKNVAIMRDLIARTFAEGRRASAGDSVLRLATALIEIGALEDAMITIEQFLKDYPELVLVRPSGLDLRGQLHAKLGQSDAAERDFRDAISSARKIGTKPAELRAATGLARLLRQRGDAGAARALLAPLHAQFSEGSDTRDVREARVLLAELGAA